MRKLVINSVSPGLDFCFNGKWYKRLQNLPSNLQRPDIIRALDINQNAVRDLDCNLIVEVES